MAKHTAVDSYLYSVESAEKRSALCDLRAIILDELPAAREGISYGIPCYELNGFVAGFAAFKNHCSFYPGHTIDEFRGELNGFKLSRGTVQFQPDHPIPEPLVRAMLRSRADENTS
jgi:uncharacterized protein YdhG (YjbR/CyaY superfamily)